MLTSCIIINMLEVDTVTHQKITKMEFLYVFLAILGLVAVALLLLSINILIKKNGKFSSQHVGQSREMKKRGVHCAQTQDRIEQNKKN